MIEKFSNEELRIIKQELRVANNTGKQNVLAAEINALYELWNGKTFAKHNCVLNLIDFTLCNVVSKERRNRKGRYSDYGVSSKINKSDIDEYKEMFQEIIEIIKKHNRPWKEGRDETL